MLQTIRVFTKAEKDDATGISLLNEINKSFGKNGIKKIRTIKVFRLEGTNQKEAKIVIEKLLCEKINQDFSLNKPFSKPRIEIAYKPGVMNPEVASIIKSANDLKIKLLACDTSKEFIFYGDIKKEKLSEIVEKLNLLNKTVEYIVEKEPQTLIIKGQIGKTQIIPLREMDDEKLMELSKDKLFLNLEEMKIIQKYFQEIKRDPKDIELETLAQTWSEHCAHKTFKARLIVDGKIKEPLIKRIKKEALKHKKNIVSAFEDNSGVMDFYDGQAICGKVETHNSPSAIEPYGGAMTGSGGVFRDILGTGLGAKTIASTDIFCFAKPDMKPSLLPKGCLPPDYLLKKVVFGVRDYGNRMGIPTNNGSIHFHNDFRAKPTVIVGAYGIIPKTKAQKGEPRKGDVIVSVGGKTGKDGIHGATFSSGEMTDKTININSAAVQIGNAIEEKRMFDAILEARDKNLIRAIQDCGAGGFSSAVGEIGKDLGVTVNLEKAKLKYQGLSPWEIWVSESQERMVLAIPKNKLNNFKNICKKYNVDFDVLGKFDNDKKLKIYFGKELICDLEMRFLHDGLPQRTMTAVHPRHSEEAKQLKNLKIPVPKTQDDWLKILKQVLSHPNIASKEPIVRMYDHSVQGTNILQPYSGVKKDGPNDAVVLRPILNKEYGMVISHGLNPVLNNIDPYWGSIWAGAEAISNYVAVGGDYKNASLINNYIWPFPDEESLWSLDRSVDAVCDLMKTLKIPVISGKDSLSSTYRSKDFILKIPPVLCMSVFGKIKDIKKTVTSDFKKPGSVIVFVGKMDYESMAGSIYLETLKTPSRWPNGLLEGGRVPKVDLKLLPKVLSSIYQGIQKEKILSSHDISEGGIITAIFEMCIGGDMGASIRLSGGTIRTDHFLFNETAGAFIIEVENEKMAKQIFKNVPHFILGKTIKEKTIRVEDKKKILFGTDIEEMKKAWKEPIKRLFP